jgi:hypothetical protein
MLEQLILEIRAGGTLETRSLAERLGITPQMIEAMLGHLQRNGLIQAYTVCDSGCLGCNLKDDCQKQAPGNIRLWQSKAENTSALD